MGRMEQLHSSPFSKVLMVIPVILIEPSKNKDAIL